MDRYREDLNEARTYLMGLCTGLNMTESLKALMVTHNVPTVKKWSLRQPGIERQPLLMARYAVTLGVRDDRVLATVLLSGMYENIIENGNERMFSAEVLNALKTAQVPMDDQTQKEHYFDSLLKSKEALASEIIGRYMDLSMMEGVLSDNDLEQNVLETKWLLLPMLEEAEKKWLEQATLIYVMRMGIKLKIYNLAQLLYLDIENPDLEIYKPEPEIQEALENGGNILSQLKLSQVDIDAIVTELINRGGVTTLTNYASRTLDEMKQKEANATANAAANVAAKEDTAVKAQETVTEDTAVLKENVPNVPIEAETLEQESPPSPSRGYPQSFGFLEHAKNSTAGEYGNREPDKRESGTYEYQSGGLRGRETGAFEYQPDEYENLEHENSEYRPEGNNGFGVHEIGAD